MPQLKIYHIVSCCKPWIEIQSKVLRAFVEARNCFINDTIMAIDPLNYIKVHVNIKFRRLLNLTVLILIFKHSCRFSMKDSNNSLQKKSSLQR